MSKYIVQKAVDLSKVRVSRRQELVDGGLSGYFYQPKYDGCQGIFILDVAGAFKVVSRTGEPLRSADHIALELSAALAHDIILYNGIVVMGELWQEDLQFSEISGKVRQHDPAPSLGFKAFDVLTASEWEAKRSARTYNSRRQTLASLPAKFRVPIYGSLELARDTVAGMQGHYDGIIGRDPNGTWAVGSGTTGEIIKFKNEVSYDLAVIGREEGEGKHAGRLGALVVRFRGGELRVGTGFSDAERQELWDKPLPEVLTLVLEVTAMGVSSEGLLREPRAKGIRFDKPAPDTGWEVQ